VLARQVLCPAPFFAFVIFQQDLAFYLGLASNCNHIYTSRLVGSQACVNMPGSFVEMGVSLNFCWDWPQTVIFLISAFE
jgi:hypothetical protein